MSDSFQSYVFGEATVDDGRADFRRVAAWLLAEEVIGEETTGNTLGDGNGHVPGARASSILVEDDANWRSLLTNGIEIRNGRIIEATGDWEFGQCPSCNARIEIDPQSEESARIYEALDAFYQGRGDEVECPKCGKHTSLSEWDFGHAMAIGNALVKFWNWPRHIESFATRMSEISGLKCRLVWGKL